MEWNINTLPLSHESEIWPVSAGFSTHFQNLIFFCAQENILHKITNSFIEEGRNPLVTLSIYFGVHIRFILYIS